MQNDTCYILALVKRDDGERILLGSGFYEFTKDQKHFNPNTFANDIVELQGADGQLLAGQVRRSTAQSFDGYIGDGTTAKTLVEQKRREFFLFFRKQHHYTVVYIMPDGTAIKRDRGYIVDAPAVQELYQVQPRWHVSLAFEDVNYYSYAEDDHGNEVYSFQADLSLASVQGGGLIWDGNGAISTPAGLGNIRISGDTFQQTYTGKNIIDQMSPYVQGYINESGVITSSTASVTATDYFPAEANTTYAISWTVVQSGTTVRKIAYYDINKSILGRSGDCTNGGTITTPLNTAFVRFYLNRSGGMDATDAPLPYIKNIQMEKGSVATPYEPFVGGAPSPSPDFPQTVQTVTGEQTVTINATSYPINLGSIELCKLGTYQDYIYKDGDDWKVHKATNKIILDGTETWSNDNGTIGTNYRHNFSFANNPTIPRPKNVSVSVAEPSLSTHFTNIPGSGRDAQILGSFYMSYAWAVFTDKNGVYNKSTFLTWLGTTKPACYYVLNSATDTTITDQALISQLEAVATAMAADGQPSSVTPTGTNLPAIFTGDLNGTGGYEWEAANGGGPSYITVNGVDDALPVWYVTGPCVNPTLTNSTTGISITWTGTVPSGQTLIVDMGAQTATMEGANVFQFISGSWLTLSPGTNRIAYTAANTTAGSKLYWNEIVG